MRAYTAQSARTVIFNRLIPAKRRWTDTGPIYGYNCALSHLIGKLRISNPLRPRAWLVRFH